MMSGHREHVSSVAGEGFKKGSHLSIPELHMAKRVTRNDGAVPENKKKKKKK